MTEPQQIRELIINAQWIVSFWESWEMGNVGATWDEMVEWEIRSWNTFDRIIEALDEELGRQYQIRIGYDLEEGWRAI